MPVHVNLGINNLFSLYRIVIHTKELNHFLFLIFVHILSG